MNLGQVKESVKRQFGDESSVQITDADILRWVEQAQEEIVRENEEVLAGIQDIDIVTNQDEYVIPEDVFVFRSLRVKTKDDVPYVSLPYLTISQFEESISKYASVQIKSATAYVFTTYNDTIFLYPKPSADVVAGMRLLYSKLPIMPLTDVDTLGVPFQFHYAVLKYCMVQAYEMDENWEASANKFAQYQTDINRHANRSINDERGTYPVITVLAEDQ